MNSIQFETSMDRLYEYFDRKTPGNASLTQWHKKCEHVPHMAMDWIIGWMTDNMDSPPRNMGKAINAGWYRYQESNPNKIARYNETPCDECRGKGILWYSFIEKDSGVRYQHNCICASCENWKLHFNPLKGTGMRLNKQDLLDKGYRLEGPSKDIPDFTPKASLKVLAASVGESISGMNKGEDIPF